MNAMIYVLLIFVMTFLGTLGAFFLKKGAGRFEKFHILTMIKIPELYVGGILYVLGACVNICLLRLMPYTVVYPLTSLTYVWTMFVSAVLLKERITANKIVAVIFIILGICFISL